MSKIPKISLLDLAWFAALSLLISLAGRAYAQSGGKQSMNASRSGTASPKLTPEQERGLRLLKAAEVESAGLQPNMHAFVLWRVSYAYTKLDPKRAARLSRNAFMATRGIEDAPENDSCAAPGSAGDIKSWIQQRVLYDMVHKDQLKEVEQLLPHATASVRNGITAELVRYYESKKDLHHAEALLSNIAESDRYPFSVAADLVTALGTEHSAERMTIFDQALNNFERHATGANLSGDDIGSFIERTWKNVPAAAALEAIDKVLEAAKESEAHSHLSMASTNGSVVLNSDYEVRLFQLLPILQELDNEKAEAILREQKEVAEQLKRHPGGMQSLQPQGMAVYSDDGSSDAGSGFSEATARQQLYAQMHDRIQEVMKKADTDPEGALANALTLPIHGAAEATSPRCEALLGIANKAAVKKPSVSKSALDEFSAIQDQLATHEMIGISRLPGLYLKIGDVDGAKKAVDILVKAAGKLYEHDIDRDDPNTAFKGSWPSTDLWGKTIQEAARISPMLPEGIITGLQDPEIAAYEKVAHGSALLGGAAVEGIIFVADCRKNAASFRISSSK